MSLKAFAALTVAATFCIVPLAAQAHQGHHHPAAKTKKVKKPRPQKSGIDFLLAAQATAAGSSALNRPVLGQFPKILTSY